MKNIQSLLAQDNPLSTSHAIVLLNYNMQKLLTLENIQSGLTQVSLWSKKISKTKLLSNLFRSLPAGLSSPRKVGQLFAQCLRRSLRAEFEVWRAQQQQVIESRGS